MTNDDDRRAADKAFDIAFRGETEGIDDAMAALFTAHRIAAERRGIERAVVACENERLPEPQDETDAAYDHAIDRCIEAIRSLNEGA